MRNYSELPDEAKPKARCYIALVVVFSLLSCLVLVFVTAIFPIVFQNLVNNQVALTNGTLSFTQWLNPTPVIYKIVTVYNVTNPIEVGDGRQPIVETIGPYYFREHREKVDVEEVYDRELIYYERKYYIFDLNATITANGPNCTLNPAKDRFTTFNIAYVGIVYNLTNSKDSPIKDAVVAALAIFEGEQTLFMQRTVNEVIFGYTDKLLVFLSAVMHNIPTTIQIVYNLTKTDTDFTSTILNGRQNYSDLGQYTQWQGHRALPWWGSAEANTVNGTEGLFFSPNLDKTHMITTFIDDLFRANPMEFIAEETQMSINTYKYAIPDYIMANASQNPINEGFYSYCPSGMMNLTAAVNAPIIVSKPSFLDAEPWLHEEVTGLPAPDKASMDTNIWVEPITGVLVKAKKQLQVNMLVSKSTKFPNLNKLRDKPRYIPIAQIVETGGMDDDLMKTFKNKVFTPRDIVIVGSWVLFILLTIIMVLFTIILTRYIYLQKSEEESKLLVPNKSDNIYSPNPTRSEAK